MNIDRAQLERDVYSITEKEILGPILVPDDQVKDEDGKVIDPKHFPPITRPVQQRAKWWEKRGVVRNPDEKYPWYWAIAKQVKPLIIAEIGTYWGYSLMAMAKGAIAGGVKNVSGQNVSVNGFDNEQYAPGCLEWARNAFLMEGIAHNLMFGDTQDMKELPLHMVNLFHVDGDHSKESCAHDLELAERTMVPRPRRDAVILVDDVGWTLGVREATESFAAKYKYDIVWLPCHKGLALLTRRK